MDNRKNSDIYFTVVPTQNSGFTDQLNQFIGLYRFGISLGYKYYHTDLKSRRSKYKPLNNKSTLFSSISRKFQIVLRILKKKFSFLQGFDVFEYMGINKYFRDSSCKLNIKDIEKCYLKFSNEFLDKNNIFLLSDLQTYVESILSNKSGKFLVIFYVTEGRRFLQLMYSDLSRSPVENELRDKYFELKRKNRWCSKFDDNKKVNIMVHIRQGDTSVIKTPWGTYIPVFALYEYVEDSFCELKDINQLKTPWNIDVNEYFRFIKKLSSEYNEEFFSFLIFSDGFKRGFSNIYRNFDQLNLTESQKKMLEKSEKDYDSKTFGIFNKIRGAKTFIGEGKKKLMDLIHAVFDADIIIIGNHQAMIPKFLSVYFDMESMPIVLVLYKKSLPRYSYIKQEILDKKFVFIDIGNPNNDYLKSQLFNKFIGSYMLKGSNNTKC